MTAEGKRRFALCFGAVVVSGAVATATATFTAGTAPALWRIAVVVAVFAVGDVALIHIRFGRDRHSFTWSETALVIAFAVVPAPWAVMAGPLGVAAVHTIMRRQPRKILFNAA